jgi:hypothetical protein
MLDHHFLPAALACAADPPPNPFTPRGRAGLAVCKAVVAVQMQDSFSLPVPAPSHLSQILHPLFDPTGIDCGVKPAGPVLFLVGVLNASGTVTRQPGQPDPSRNVTGARGQPSCGLDEVCLGGGEPCRDV